MTSLERAIAAIKGRIPDRVPVDLHNFLVASEMMGESYPLERRNSNLLFFTLEPYTEKYFTKK